MSLSPRHTGFAPVIFFILVFAAALPALIACEVDSLPNPSPLSTDISTETVNIEDLVKLAETNILAADQFKGKTVKTVGLVAKVDSETITLVGLLAANSVYGIESALSGFDCHYSAEMSRAE